MKTPLLFTVILFLVISGCSTSRSELNNEEVSTIIANCANRPPTSQEVDSLLADRQNSIAQILASAGKYKGVKNYNVFHLLYTLCFVSEVMVPECIEQFSCLNEAIPWYIKLLDEEHYSEVRKKGEIWPEHPEEFLIMCGDNSIPFLNKAVEAGDKTSKQAQQIIVAINAVKSKQKTLSEVLR